MITLYTVPEIWHMTDVIVIFHFGYFCCFTPLAVQKIKTFKKMKKTTGDVLCKCTKNYDMLYCS